MKRMMRKALRDIFQDRHRALVSLAAIILGMLAFGTLFFTYEVMVREINRVFTLVDSPSGSITLTSVDDKAKDIVLETEGVSDIEVKGSYMCQTQNSDGEWKNTTLYTADDYKQMKYNKVLPIEGKATPEEGEVLIERDAVSVTGLGIGEMLTFKLSDGRTVEYKIVGLVNDLDEHPAGMHNCVYAYLSTADLEQLGIASNQIEFIIDQDPYQHDRIMEISNEIISRLENEGYPVLKLAVSNTPGVSIHLAEYKGVLLILQWFAVILFLFGCFIMANLLSSILSNQVRQIGILKAIGAKTSGIFVAYMVAIFVLVMIAMGLSLLIVGPLTTSFTTVLMKIGNMTPISTAIPFWNYVIFILAGTLLPVIVSMFPIRQGIRVTVKEAIASYGVKDEKVKRENLKRSRFLSRPTKLSIRNAFRRKGRFILNTGILTVGGALFVTAVTCLISAGSKLNNNLDTYLYQHQVVCSTAIAKEEISEAVNAVDEITEYEITDSCKGKLVHTNGEIGNSYSFNGLNPESKMLKPTLTEGRWLTEADKTQVVVGHKFFDEEPGYKLGDTICFKIADQLIECEIVGVAEIYSGFPIYINQSYIEQVVPLSNRQYSVQLGLKESDLRENDYISLVEEKLDENGIPILMSQSKSELNDVMNAHFDATLQTYLIVIVFIVLVSIFGLSATMNVQIAERTKEIGIMKAIGAIPAKVSRIITAESVCICLISWCLSVPLGLLVSMAGTYAFGINVLSLPITLQFAPFTLSLTGWLLASMLIGIISSRNAAKRAVKMTIRETMTYSG